MADRADRDRLVQSQYEGYPYPERKPADEKKRLISGSPSNLAEVIHHVFGGRLDPARPFRALVAGGGTGDAVMMLGQGMADRGITGEVVHLDLSEPSQAVARERAKVRGLDNIRFVRGSLLDVAELAPGPYDYIDCCGVLHHLEEPEAGLAALAGQLAPHGGIGIMVYGALGRIGIYDMQEMLRTVAPAGELADQRRVDIAKRLIATLPPTAWLRRNGLIRDHIGGGDPGIYDLFLHARDRAYRVPDVAALAASADMRIVTLLEPFHYDPDLLVGDPQIRKRLDGLPFLERAAFAEMFAGDLKKHVFYVVKADNPVAAPEPNSLSAIPVLVNQTPEEAERLMPAGGTITVSTEGTKIKMPVPTLARAIVALCDGKRDLAAIHAAIREKRGDLDEAGFMRQFTQLYRTMLAINRMALHLPPD